MSNKNQSEAEFQASLAARLSSLNKPATQPNMVMTKPPTGPSKSLEELLQSKESEHAVVDATNIGKSIEKIAVQLIDDSPWQPRTKYDESYIQALGDMLLDRGQDDPINVRLMPNGRYELISGHRRVRAARLIGWSTINAQINKLDDRNAELATLVSNEGRIDLTDYEKAKTYKRAIERGFAKTQTDVARLFGCTQARVAQCLSLLNLPDQVKAILDKYPSLFGYRYGKVISDLIKEFPEGLETILLGVEQLIDNHELTSDDLRSFVEKQLVKRVRGLPTKPTLIVDSNGVSLFAVKVTDKQIIIDVKENADASIAGKHTLAALRDLAAQFGSE